MSTVILNGTKTFGKSIFQSAARIGISYAQNAIASAFDNRVYEGPRLEILHIQSSQDGAPMARIFGKVRIAGQVIWAARIREHITEERAGSKGGGPRINNYSYTLSFAIGLCEGEILDVGAIWANGKILQTKDMNTRLYLGTQTQEPDDLIAEIEGEQAPAFRGCAYMVFEDMPIDDFGGRFPQLNFEIIRLPKRINNEPRLEDLIQAVDLIPASGEFAYATSITEDQNGTGETHPINMNNLQGVSDLQNSLDQLQRQLPNCTSVTLVVSWFGNDLRAGQCDLRPGVERSQRLTYPLSWSVSGEERQDAYQISMIDNRSVYGGTPDDRSVIEAIQTLKTRGYSVTLMPFILMDIPQGNTLTNPYDVNGGPNGQPTLPWRGRITCNPAIGQPNSADQTSNASAQVQSFFGQAQASDFTVANHVQYSGPAEYSFRRMALHYAHLSELAGGVDRFVIGTEMVGLTTIRGQAVGGAAQFPAVQALRDLASDVKTVVGNTCQLTYAADWSEYFGYHPSDGSGDVFYHLDPLWADPAIDAVGIDAYFPLSDWRDTNNHLDLNVTDTIYDRQYLMSNIEAGEGYDWYYASSQDRLDQIRTPITDGLGKPWVYRNKDIKNWWSNQHFNRANGVEMITSSAWVPKSKPIWFCEIGCPAIDKGSNQPNVFWDPKSSESLAPYFSTTDRDDLIQRAYLEAILLYWQNPNHNPLSDQYSGRMIDISNTHIWCWDARPYPDFPARLNVWSDGENWEKGHWLNGRTGLVRLADVIWDISNETFANTDIGFPIDVSKVNGVLSGYILDRPMSARAALSPLCAYYGVDIIERPDGLKFISQDVLSPTTLSLSDCVQIDGNPVIGLDYADIETQAKDVRIGFIDQARDYQIGHKRARNLYAKTSHIIDIQLPLVLDGASAKRMANALLEGMQNEDATLSLSLSSNHLSLEVGDMLNFDQNTDGASSQISSNLWQNIWKITNIEGNEQIHIKAKKISNTTATATATANAVNAGTIPVATSTPIWGSKPEGYVLDIANFSTDQQAEAGRNGILVGSIATPWVPSVFEGPDSQNKNCETPVAIGSLNSEFAFGPISLISGGSAIDIFLPGINLANITEVELLAGGNKLAVQTQTGWEIFQCQNCELIAENTYRISRFLRGLHGTDTDMMAVIPSGAVIAYLGQGWTELSLGHQWKNEPINLEYYSTGRSDVQTLSLTYQARHLRPLSPVHIRSHITTNSLDISWTRRTREGGDDWDLIETPLGEAFERYLVVFKQNQSTVAYFEAQQSSLSIPLNELSAIYGQLPSQIQLEIMQISNTYGQGAAAAHLVQLV